VVIGFKQRMGLEANESAPIQSWAVGCKGLCGALVLFALLFGAPAVARAGGDEGQAPPSAGPPGPWDDPD
jgi:hypothetical protein